MSTKDIPLDSAAACQFLKDGFGKFLGKPKQQCAEVCGDPAVNTCNVDEAYQKAILAANPSLGTSGAGGGGGAGGGSGTGTGTGPTMQVNCPDLKATLTCQDIESGGEYHNGCPIDGRRPAGLAAPVVDGSAIGIHLATSAHLEAASIIAFQILRAELGALGAPRELLDDARRAEADEVRHTEVMTRLAATYGALVPEIEIASPGARSAAAIAVENTIEGVVRETFGAAVALFQVDHAGDPAIRAAMRDIAVDECAHAALAFRAAAFLDEHLDAIERARVEASKQEAMRGLFASLVEPDATLRRLAGLPSVAESRQILEGMVSALWSAPLAA